MNRPHVAALLREIAAHIAKEGRIADFALPDDEPALKAEVDRLISDLAERLRARAGEIEAGG